MAEAVARTPWEAGGVWVQPLPLPLRPGTFSQVAEDVVPLSGQPSRAVVVHASPPEPRRQKRLEREGQASSPPRVATVRAPAPQAYCCRAAAAAAAAPRQARQSAYPRGAGGSEERPQEGPGRPSQQQPRRLQARREGLPVTLHERAEGVARQRPEAGGWGRLTPVPTAGERAPRAGAGLRASQEQPGVEQNGAFFPDPRIGQRLLRKQPERIEARGLVVGRALRRGRLGARTLRVHGETTGHTGMGGDTQATQQPTACRRMTTWAAGMGRTVGGQRQLAQPLSAVQQASRNALGVPLTSFPLPPRG